eukprot:3409927-Rhodomonas_salina.1
MLMMSPKVWTECRGYWRVSYCCGIMIAVVLFEGCVVFKVEELDGVAVGELKDDDELFDFASRRRVADDDAVNILLVLLTRGSDTQWRSAKGRKARPQGLEPSGPTTSVLGSTGTAGYHRQPVLYP